MLAPPSRGGFIRMATYQPELPPIGPRCKFKLINRLKDRNTQRRKQLQAFLADFRSFIRSCLQAILSPWHTRQRRSCGHWPSPSALCSSSERSLAQRLLLGSCMVMPSSSASNQAIYASSSRLLCSSETMLTMLSWLSFTSKYENL